MAKKKLISKKKQKAVSTPLVKIHPLMKWINENQISVGHPVTWKELLNR